MITAGTYQKQHHFNSEGKLTILRDRILSLAQEYEINLQAWAVMSNHYHFICVVNKESGVLKYMIKRLHGSTARDINKLDNTPARKVWFQYWDSHITFEKSYFVRLKYVHYNPEHHKIVECAANYQWCSASWFQLKSEPAFFKRISGLKIDEVKVPDDF